jgi:MSHA biogenesis protein MshQ
LTANDSSENSSAGNGIITSSMPAVFNGTGSDIAFDASNQFRFGRLLLSNANGAETLDLPVPMATQYWNGSNFVNNTDDNCTRLSGLNISLKNYTKNLAACETAIALSAPFNAGKSNLTLVKPGTGNNGSVDLLVNLGASATGQTCIAPTPTTQQAATAAAQSYLQGKWSGVNYDQNPTARATFGIYKNANEFIYMREMY